MLDLDAGEIDFWQRAYAAALASGHMDPAVRADRAVGALRDRICGPRVTCGCGAEGWCTGDLAIPIPLGWSMHMRGQDEIRLCPACSRRYEQGERDFKENS